MGTMSPTPWNRATNKAVRARLLTLLSLQTAMPRDWRHTCALVRSQHGSLRRSVGSCHATLRGRPVSQRSSAGGSTQTTRHAAVAALPRGLPDSRASRAPPVRTRRALTGFKGEPHRPDIVNRLEAEAPHQEVSSGAAREPSPVSGSRSSRDGRRARRTRKHGRAERAAAKERTRKEEEAPGRKGGGGRGEEANRRRGVARGGGRTKGARRGGGPQRGGLSPGLHGACTRESPRRIKGGHGKRPGPTSCALCFDPDPQVINAVLHQNPTPGSTRTLSRVSPSLADGPRGASRAAPTEGRAGAAPPAPQSRSFPPRS